MATKQTKDDEVPFDREAFPELTVVVDALPRASATDGLVRNIIVGLIRWFSAEREMHGCCPLCRKPR